MWSHRGMVVLVWLGLWVALRQIGPTTAALLTIMSTLSPLLSAHNPPWADGWASSDCKHWLRLLSLTFQRRPVVHKLRFMMRWQWIDTTGYTAEHESEIRASNWGCGVSVPAPKHVVVQYNIWHVAHFPARFRARFLNASSFDLMHTTWSRRRRKHFEYSGWKMQKKWRLWCWAVKCE